MVKGDDFFEAAKGLVLSGIIMCLSTFVLALSLGLGFSVALSAMAFVGSTAIFVVYLMGLFIQRFEQFTNRISAAILLETEESKEPLPD